VCHQVVESLDHDARSAARGRQIVASVCRDWRLESVCDDLALPVSELVTNAVVHAGTGVALTLSLTEDFVEVAVHDNSRRAPILRPVDVDGLRDELSRETPVYRNEADGKHNDDSSGGRGLHIVDAVADEWGAAELADGKTVWFRIRTPNDWHADPPCPCAGGGRITPGGQRIG
jgi:anti-sigma regulatory factor (Ser/Thr protein kinase)